MNYITSNIKIVLCRLKNSTNGNDSGEMINNKVPNEWKMTEDKKKVYSTYLRYQEFSQYSFRSSKKNRKSILFNNNSLYKYADITNSNSDITKIYAILLKEISPFINNLSLLVGDSTEEDDTFTNQYSYIIMKYIFLLILYRLSSIINNIDDDPQYNTILKIVEESSDIYPLFNIKEDDSDSPAKTIVSKLVFDMIFNIYLENNENENIKLYYNEDLLNEIITKEKEREKVSVVDKLTNMDHEKRGIEIQLQECGIKNIYKSKEAENLEWIQSDAYQEFRMSERDLLIGDTEIVDDIIDQHEFEQDLHIDRMDENDNLDVIDGEDGYDNDDYAQDELED